MESVTRGELVTVVPASGGGAALDGIVFDVPSRTKVVVAVVDPGRGPALRTVHPSTLTARAEEGSHDPALRLLIRRTPPPSDHAARGGAAGRRGQAGFTRGPAHRPTGR